MTRTVIRPFTSRQPDPDVAGGFFENEVCQAIRAGGHVFVRGQVGQTLDGEMVGVGDPGAQARQALENIRILLEEAGARLGDVVKMTIYVTDRAHRPAVYRAISEFMRGGRYCSTGVVVSGLASPEMLVEIDAHAVIDDGESAPSAT